MSWEIEKIGRVVVVTMNTNKVNAQNESFFADLHEALDTLDAKYPGAATVLTAKGTTFSAGLDLEYTFPVFASGDPKKIASWWDRYRATNLRLFTANRPFIAAMNGHAIAGGLITALACDYRVATAESEAFQPRYALNEVPIGIGMPSIYIEMIRFAVGNRITSLWTLFGRFYGSDEALRDGVVDELVPHDKVLERALEVANELSEDALEAFVSSKRNLRLPTVTAIEQLSSKVDTGTPPGNRSVSANTEALKKLKAGN